MHNINQSGSYTVDAELYSIIVIANSVVCKCVDTEIMTLFIIRILIYVTSAK